MLQIDTKSRIRAAVDCSRVFLLSAQRISFLSFFFNPLVTSEIGCLLALTRTQLTRTTMVSEETKSGVKRLTEKRRTPLCRSRALKMIPRVQLIDEILLFFPPSRFFPAREEKDVSHRGCRTLTSPPRRVTVRRIFLYFDSERC